MHGFCPHGDLKKDRERERERGEREQRRGEMRGTGRSGDERERDGVGEEKGGQSIRRDKEMGGGKGG